MYDASMHVDHRSPMPSVETQKAYRSAAMRDLRLATFIPPEILEPLR
jgi:hypothetical protein